MKSTFISATLGLAALLPAPVSAFWRMPCGSRLLDERIDPIIFPGTVSPHVHEVVGGNGFGHTETYEEARDSTCSTCPITADLSNYWTPTLYYQYESNGSFVKVPMVGDGSNALGGITVYYLQRNDGADTPLYAFPEGFRMVAGNPYKRNYTGDSAAEAINFACLGQSEAETNGLPTYECPTGLRAQVFFPSCWNGVDLDSSDHESHMSYPTTGSYDNGGCPDDYPIQFISIFFEVTFETQNFDFWEGSYGTGQPFVFAMGDPTGYGFHGDFINGWDVDVLQNAIDDCTSSTGDMDECSYFDFFSDDEMAWCKLPTTIDEDVEGPFSALPGCNAVQTGPSSATQAACSTPTIGAADLEFTDATSSGWSYVGCAVDDASTLDLTGYTNEYNSDVSGTDDVTLCLAYCEKESYKYGAVKLGHQCFCGKTLNNDPTIYALAACALPCEGNSTQNCGGSELIALYETCTGSTCTNQATYTPVGDLYGTGSTALVTAYFGGSDALNSALASLSSSSGSSTAASTSKSASASATATSTKASSTSGSSTKVTSSSSSAAASSSATTTKAVVNKARATKSKKVNKKNATKKTVTVDKTVDKSVYITKTVTQTVTAAAGAKRANHAGHLKQHQQKRDAQF